MSIPCPHVAGSVSDFGDEHPEKYRVGEPHDEGSDVQRYEDEERRRPESSEGKE
jgi:hypothetical protein